MNRSASAGFIPGLIGRGFLRQQLPRRGRCYRIGMAGEEGPGLLHPLLREHRAGDVQQFAAGPQQRPKRVEQRGLRGRERGNVGGATQPADVGVAAGDARGAAGRVEQNAVEGLSVPPGGWMGGVGGEGVRLQAEAVQGVFHPTQTLSVFVEGEQVAIAAFEQMHGLAARRGAGVEHALARLDVEQGGGVLRGGVLHAHPAALEAGQALNRHRLLQNERLVEQGVVWRRARQPARSERGLIVGARLKPGVHPQRHGRLSLRDFEHA